MVAIAVLQGVALHILEVRVVARLLGRDAARRIVDEHHLQQVEARVVEVGAEGLRLVADPLGERRLEVGVGGDAGPDIISRGA